MALDLVQKINKLLADGDYTAAQKRIRPLAKKEPKNAGLQNMAGLCHTQGGSNNQALPYFAAATKLAPKNVDFRCNLALCLVMMGKDEQALAQIERLLTEAPNDGRPYYYKALIFEREGDHLNVVRNATLALERAPEMTEALKVRATSRVEILHNDKALEDFRTIVAMKPNDIVARRALALQLTHAGHQAEAVSEFFTIYDRNPNDARALNQLARLCSDEQLETVTEGIQKLSQSKPRDNRDKVFRELAQASLLSRLGDTSASISHLDEMHSLDVKDRPWKVKNGWQQLKRLTQSFPMIGTGTAIEDSGPEPLFVVGLPRSGTTLVEMILSASDSIFSCGELTAAAHAYRRALEPHDEPTAEIIAEFASVYRSLVPPLPDGTTAFTDKMPANFRFVGPLLEAFPNARVVNINRDPRDVAFSMWQVRFPADGMNYTNRLDWIADQANLYRSYIEHWEDAYPDRLLSIQYEDLVRDIVTGTRTLAEHFGIEWSEKMLSPESNKSRVRTASVWQVRQKVHDKSIGRWHAFGDNLTKLTDNLDKDLWPDISTA